MAFSILQHWQDSYSPQLLEALKDDFSPDQTEQLIDLAMATVLAHLVAQGRQQGYAELRRRLMFEAPESIWNSLDRTQLAEQIAAGIRTAAGAPGLAERLATAGLVLPPIEGPAQTVARIAADAPRWREMVEVSGARIE